MKKIFFLFSLFATTVAGAQQKQSLRDLLYSGKLRTDSNTVVRRSDDLSTKIDTGTRKPAEAEKTAQPVATAAVETQTTAASTTTVSPAAAPVTSATTPATTEAAETAVAAPVVESKPAAPVKSNTKLLKEYTDSLVSGLRSEVLSSKKIKKDTYFVIAEYEINPDGTVVVGNVTSSPENALLQSEVKTRMEVNELKLAPVTDSAGNAKKVKRKLSFSVTKE